MRESKRLFNILLTIALAFLMTGIAYANDNVELPVPVGTKLSLELLSAISTSKSQKGDKFTCKVLTPAEYAGATVEGHIRSLKRSGKVDKQSHIDLAFDKITLADGRTADLHATVIEVFEVANVSEQGRADNEGTVRTKSTTVKTSIKRAATGALIGALIGGAIAGGKGAAAGAAIGASVGVTTTLAAKGPDLNFKDGTQFTVEANGPARKKRSAPSAGATEGAVSSNSDLESLASNSASGAGAPQPPSQEYRSYTGSKSFTLRVPANWIETGSGEAASFAPAGGQNNFQGKPNLTHGAMIGVVPSQIQDLQKASALLVGALLQSNSYLQRQADTENVTIAGRPALTSTLLGTAAATGQTERVTVHTSILSNGKMFYMISVVPQQEYDSYREAFENVLRSIQFNN